LQRAQGVPFTLDLELDKYEAPDTPGLRAVLKQHSIESEEFSVSLGDNVPWQKKGAASGRQKVV